MQACPGKRRGLVGGYHRYPDRRGLALPGRDPRPVHPQDSWLGDARAYARRTYDGRTDHGRPTAPSEGGLDPSRGSRQPVRRRRLPQHPAGRRHHPIDEPQAKPPGQCTNRERLRHPENRTRPSARIPRPRCRAARPGRVHRSLLQSSADPLRYRLHHPGAGRPENRITRCPLSRGKVSRAYRSLPLREPAHRRRRWRYSKRRPSGHKAAVIAKFARHRGAFPMAIIDSQVHVYEANTPQRPWHSVPNWPAHVTGDEMVAAMDKVGVDGAIFISAFSMYQYDASYAVEVQQAHPDRFAIVKPVNPDDPAVADVIADWKKVPGAVGIRIMLTREANRAPDDPGLDRICRAAVTHDFPVNVLFWGNIEAGAALLDRHPETRFIIDHLAILQPREPPAPPLPWADLPKVLDLAKRPNAVIKVSGACTLSREPYPFPDIWDPLARILDAWGFERCLWGTDWTRAFAVVNYEQAVEPFVKTDRLSDSERAMLMGGACAKAYGWSPKNG